MSDHTTYTYEELVVGGYQHEPSRKFAYESDYQELKARLAAVDAVIVQWRNDADYDNTMAIYDIGALFPERLTDSASVCLRCHGTGAINTATSADDPSCPDCDGEGVRR